MMTHGKNWTTDPPFVSGEFLRLYDPYTHSLTVIQEPHRLAHDGMVFNVTGKLTGLIDTGTQDLLIQTGGAYMHLHRFLIALGAGDIDIVTYEGTTHSSAGTPLVVHNTNRNSTNASLASLSYTPTVTTTGTLVHRKWIVPTATGIGPRPDTGISDLANGEEWILKPQTSYLIRITNNSGGTISLAFDFLWYEVSYVEE